MKIGSLFIDNELALIRVRKIVNSLCRLLLCTKIERVKIGTAASTLAINIFEYSGEGELIFSLLEEKHKKGLEFSIKDRNRRKDEVEKLLNENDPKSGIHGAGLANVKNTMDEFSVDSLPKKGIKISAILWFKDSDKITDLNVNTLKTIFLSVSETTAIDVLKILNKDFIGLLQKLQQKNVSLTQENLDLKDKTIKLSYERNISDGNMKREKAGRICAEIEYSKKQQVLEAIFLVTTQYLDSLDTFTEAILWHIAKLSKAFLVSLSIHTTNSIIAKNFLHNKIVNTGKILYKGSELSVDRVVVFKEKLSEIFISDLPGFSETKYAFGMPISTVSQDIIGNLFVFFQSDTRFEEFEEKLLKIFTRYIGREYERHEMQVRLKQDAEVKTLGLITSGVAHEVRNPLNAIVTVSEALFRKIGDNSQYSQHIFHIRNQVERLTALMQDLLTLGRPLREENITLLSLTKCIDQCLNNWRAYSKYAGRMVVLQTKKDLGQYHFRIDQERFQQVITNLLDNACYFSPENEPILIQVSLSIGVRKKEMCLKIIDRGPGMDEVYVKDYFKPFFSMRKGGTGLGAAIVKRIIELHNGIIFVYNNEPKPGFCVEIRFPIIQTFTVES